MADPLHHRLTQHYQALASRWAERWPTEEPPPPPRTAEGLAVLCRTMSARLNHTEPLRVRYEREPFRIAERRPPTDD